MSDAVAIGVEIELAENSNLNGIIIKARSSTGHRTVTVSNCDMIASNFPLIPYTIRKLADELTKGEKNG